MRSDERRSDDVIYVMTHTAVLLVTHSLRRGSVTITVEIRTDCAPTCLE